MWRRKSAPDKSARPEAVRAEPVREREQVPAVALTIDAIGRKCPIPIIMLADQINTVGLGSVVAVLADDPAAFTDIPAWCRLKSHEHVGSHDLPQGGWAIHVRRNY